MKLHSLRKNEKETADCGISESMDIAPKWIHLGLIDYQKAWELQLSLVEKRKQDQIPDLLLLCEHPHVVTIGRRLTGRTNVLSDRFPVYEVERGGDATYHGPGQLVGYFILKLQPHESDPHAFLRKVEGALIQICEACGITAFAKEKYTGVWTESLSSQNQTKKIASLGVSLRHGVIFHGFALNVTTDLSCFSVINPCGLSAQVMTSVENEGGFFQGEKVSVSALLEKTAQEIGNTLGRVFQPQQTVEGV